VGSSEILLHLHPSPRHKAWVVLLYPGAAAALVLVLLLVTVVLLVPQLLPLLLALLKASRCTAVQLKAAVARGAGAQGLGGVAGAAGVTGVTGRWDCAPLLASLAA
jgi:hypothetical protein